MAPRTTCRITASWKASTVGYAMSPSMSGSSPATGMPEKYRRMDDQLQRGAPAWGDRAQGPDLVAQSRWRRQPAIVRKPGNSTFRRSREWYRSRNGRGSNRHWMTVQGQVTSDRCRTVPPESQCLGEAQLSRSMITPRLGQGECLQPNLRLRRVAGHGGFYLIAANLVPLAKDVDAVS